MSRKDREFPQHQVSYSEDVGGGNVCVWHTGVIASVVAQRFCGGETIAEIAKDYEVPADDIESAIRLVLLALPGLNGHKVEQRMVDIIQGRVKPR